MKKYLKIEGNTGNDGIDLLKLSVLLLPPIFTSLLRQGKENGPDGATRTNYVADETTKRAGNFN